MGRQQLKVWYYETSHRERMVIAPSQRRAAELTGVSVGTVRDYYVCGETLAESIKILRWRLAKEDRYEFERLNRPNVQHQLQMCEIGVEGVYERRVTHMGEVAHV